MARGFCVALVAFATCCTSFEVVAAERVPSASGFSAADFTNHLKRLAAKVPAGFTVTVQPPFVIIGDEPAEIVRRRSTNTVKWAVDRLKKAYFKRDPTEIIDIWLFKDKASYEKNTKEIFDDTPTTPFGYYSAHHRALIMNIATGGGTLVHEIVHPFMRANFPACPAWFNEGMGSLYEQCGEKEGEIDGKTNWRLAGLKSAIRERTTVPFTTLLAMDDDQFYNADKGTHYAQARYLCYYLQEKGLLRKYFQEFVSHARDDATGLKSLKKVLNETDLDAFQKKWETTFVLKLTFP